LVKLSQAQQSFSPKGRNEYEVSKKVFLEVFRYKNIGKVRKFWPIPEI